MPRRITLQDIADHCCVSKSTVCKALRNSPLLTKETKAIVQAAAKKLGYRPDPALSRLAAARWRGDDSGGLPVAWGAFDDEASHASLLALVRTAAAQSGRRVDVFRSDMQGGFTGLHRVLQTRGIQGLLLAPLYSEAPGLAKFPGTNTSWFPVTAGSSRLRCPQ